MSVKLIFPKENCFSPDTDFTSIMDLITYCARVSNPKNQNTLNTGKKLIDYLISHKHWSPFEMISVCMEIETTRDISRQIIRHRSFSFQEFSQRYASPTEHLEFQIKETRMQDYNNRQSSLKCNNELLIKEWEDKQQKIIDLCKNTYEWALSSGIAKEVARSILPEGNTKTRLYMNGTIRSWIHYIELRSSPSTQKEHRDIAIQCAKAMVPIFPIIDDFVSL
jgi:thymidylate synthase (FAD)